MLDMSSVLKDSTPVSPPALTIFFLRSLTESSLTWPTRVQFRATEGSVVRRTRAMARCSESSAPAEEADASSNAPSKPSVLFMPIRPFMVVLCGDPGAWRVII